MHKLGCERLHTLSMDKHQLLLLMPKGSLGKVKTVDNLTSCTTYQNMG